MCDTSSKARPSWQVLRSNTAMFYFMEFMERNHAMPRMQFLMLADRSVLELTKAGERRQMPAN